MDDKIQKLQENNISPFNQNGQSVFFTGEGNGFKIMFVGNSIAKHSPKPQVGWLNNCGMAASSIDKDYVHLVAEKCKKEYHDDTSFCIVQVANYERELNPDRLEELYSDAKDYNPDILIMFIGANAPKIFSDGNVRETAPEVVEQFGMAYETLRNYLVGENTLVFHSDGFYIRPDLDDVKKKISQKYNDTYINIEDIRNKIGTHGKFNHPNDLGMFEIANRFWGIIKEKLEVQNG